MHRNALILNEKPTFCFGFQLLLTMTLLVFSSGMSFANKQVIRCNALESQFQKAVIFRKENDRRQATALAIRGKMFCNSAKPAQGQRYYMKAFEVLEVEPILPKN